MKRSRAQGVVSSCACPGHALIIGICCMTTIAAFCALAADFGRITVARSELQAATDAAARYAARNMRSQRGGISAAADSAAAVFAENRIDGGNVSFTPATDMTLGIWNSLTRTFTPATIAQGANAVKINTTLVLGDAERPMALTSMFRGPLTIHAQCIAAVSGQSASTYVSAKSNLWLSGMPAGSVSQNLRPDNSTVWDYAGSGANVASSPGTISLSDSNIVPGQSILFDSINGNVSNSGSGSGTNADGNAGWVVNLGTANGIGTNNWPNSVNGISNIKAPMSSMLAVFLSDGAPNATTAPQALDFTTAASRDYTSITPDLKQVFFVGDGRRSNGEVQQIIVPPGATRLFIGNMDAWQWNDNTGGYTTTINSVVTVTTVK